MKALRIGIGATILLGCAVGHAQPRSAEHDDEQAEAGVSAGTVGAESGGEAYPTFDELPAGRAVANLEPSKCLALLRRVGVDFEEYEGEGADDMAVPILLKGPIGGVSIEHAGGSEVHSALDCRLAVALLRWSPVLREADIVRIEHFSAFRPGARVRRQGTPSAHAVGLALDAGRFELGDGTEIDVVEHWKNRRRGQDPCPGPTSEPNPGKTLRSIVCEAVNDDLFQVVITPHHDRAHRNHVHLELVPNVDWSYIR